MKHPHLKSAPSFCIAAVAAAAALGLASAHAQTENTNAATAKARAAVAEFAASLKKSLMEAMDAGGPKAALAACQQIAPDVARTASETHGLSIGRTALRVRNQANVPDEFERRALEEFMADIAGGTEPEKLERIEIISDGTTRTLRYMKPIMMAEKPCAACHGSNIAPEVRDTIKELYPQDTATGFTPGELRGAFTVSMPLDGKAPK